MHRQAIIFYRLVNISRVAFASPKLHSPISLPSLYQNYFFSFNFARERKAFVLFAMARKLV
jgi:hypothetical protein